MRNNTHPEVAYTPRVHPSENEFGKTEHFLAGVRSGVRSTAPCTSTSKRVSVHVYVRVCPQRTVHPPPLIEGVYAMYAERSSVREETSERWSPTSKLAPARGMG